MNFLILNILNILKYNKLNIELFNSKKIITLFFYLFILLFIILFIYLIYFFYFFVKIRIFNFQFPLYILKIYYKNYV